MNILIDTNVLYWLSNDVTRIGKKTAQLLTDKANSLYVSYISLMELVIKTGSGKISFNYSESLKQIADSDIEIVMPDTDLLGGYKIYNPDNKDPFDNLLIAAACSNRFTLITTDKKILNTKSAKLKTFNAQT